MTARASDRIVTRQDVLAALVRMGTLPTRSSDDATAELGIYVEALGGVKADHLAGAVRAIIRGSLGHGFLPSPPELRIECDKIAKAEAAAAAREHAERRRWEEVAEYRRTVEHSPESRARVQAMVDQFLGRAPRDAR